MLIFVKPHMSQNLEPIFAALADHTRLRLLNLVSRGEICVCYFVEILGEAQPKISRHLAYLRRVGLVAARRDGKWMHYSLAGQKNPRVARVVEAIIDELREDAALRRDLDALSRACCAVRLPKTLRDAPRPQIAST